MNEKPIVALSRFLVVWWWDHTSPDDWQDEAATRPSLTASPGWLCGWHHDPDDCPPYLTLLQTNWPLERAAGSLATILWSDIEQISDHRSKVLYRHPRPRPDEEPLQWRQAKLKKE